MRLLAANGLIDSKSAEGLAGTSLVKENVTSAAAALRKGELDAAFFVAAFEADYILALLHDNSVKLMSFDQHEAYQRRFRFLAPVTVPAGMVNLGKNIPAQDVTLLAPTAMIVVRKDFHPALATLLLTIGTHIHGQGDELSKPGEFPSALLRLPGQRGRKELLQIRPACTATAASLLAGLAGGPGQGDADSACDADDARAQGGPASDALASQA